MRSLRLSKPQHFLFLAALLLIIASLFVSVSTIDIHAHDTFYVIDYKFCFYVLAALALILALLYVACRRFLNSRFLTWLHVMITLAAILVLVLTFVIAPVDLFRYTGIPRMYVNYSEWGILYRNIWGFYEKLIVISIIALIVAQVVFIINLVAGSIKLIRK